MKTSSLFPIACGALAAALCLPAAAQDTTKKILTREELRACMDSEAQLPGRKQAIEERVAKHGQEVEAIRAEAVQLNEEQKKVADDPPNSPRRPRVERRWREHEARLKAAQESGNVLAKDRDALGQDVAAYNQGCTGVSYDRADREAILKEREAAGKK